MIFDIIFFISKNLCRFVPFHIKLINFFANVKELLVEKIPKDFSYLYLKQKYLNG